MKKTYINPIIEVVNIETAQILNSASVEGFASGLNSEPVEDAGNGTNALSRGSSLWDDED